MLCTFFFQAEDGIRDGHVTGVQTCALPIWARIPMDRLATANPLRGSTSRTVGGGGGGGKEPKVTARSEERRVGKEGRCRWSTEQERKNMGRERGEQKKARERGRERQRGGKA